MLSAEGRRKVGSWEWAVGREEKDSAEWKDSAEC